jgi:hypothetical protein
MIKTALLMMAAASLAWGQGAKFYKLDFVVKELDAGKVQTSKSYSVIGSVTSGGNTMVRSGDKVPVPANGGQYTYLDVGVNIDCKLVFETATDLALQVSADISSVGNVDATRSASPTISQTKWNSNVIVPLKKATLIFSSESPASKRTTQLEVTATPLQ